MGNRCLIIALARLGDLVQSTTVIQTMRAANPACRITMLLNGQFSQAASIIAGVDEFVVLDFALLRDLMTIKGDMPNAYAYLQDIFLKLRSRSFERIVNITPHDIGITAAYLADAADRFEHQRESWNMFYLNITRNWESLPMHVVDVHIHMAGLVPAGIGPQVSVSEEPMRFVKEMLPPEFHEGDHKIIGMHIGASSNARQWPPEYFVAVADQLYHQNPHVRFILFGSGKEVQSASAVEKLMSAPVFNAAGKTTLDQLAAFLSIVDMLLSGDTGPLHIAAACGTRTVGLYMGKAVCQTTGAYGEGHISVQPTIECYPCHAPDSCRHGRCKKNISPVMIADLLHQLLWGGGNVNTLRMSDDALVFRSVFDHNSMLLQVPYVSRRLTWHELCKIILMNTWEIVFGDYDNGQSLEIAIGNYARNIQEYARKYYSGMDATVSRRCEELRSKVDALRGKIEQAAALAGSIAYQISIKNVQLASMQQKARALEQIDRQIVAATTGTTAVLPIVQMYFFEKEQMPEKDLPAVAKATVQQYQQLNLRLAVFQKLIQCFMNLEYRLSGNRLVAQA